MLVTVERLLSVLDANNSPSVKRKVRPVLVVGRDAVGVVMSVHVAAKPPAPNQRLSICGNSARWSVNVV